MADEARRDFSAAQSPAGAHSTERARLARTLAPISQRAFVMDSSIDIRRNHIDALRGEAHFLAAAGYVLMGVSLPLTMFFVAMALSGHGGSPFLPIAAGAPPMMIGYMACHFATLRLAKASVLDR